MVCNFFPVEYFTIIDFNVNSFIIIILYDIISETIIICDYAIVVFHMHVYRMWQT